MFPLLQAGSHPPTRRNYINFALIAKFTSYISLFNMVEINLSASACVAFILAAATIAPVLSLPAANTTTE